MAPTYLAEKVDLLLGLGRGPLAGLLAGGGLAPQPGALLLQAVHLAPPVLEELHELLPVGVHGSQPLLQLLQVEVDVLDVARQGPLEVEEGGELGGLALAGLDDVREPEGLQGLELGAPELELALEAAEELVDFVVPANAANGGSAAAVPGAGKGTHTSTTSRCNRRSVDLPAASGPRPAASPSSEPASDGEPLPGRPRGPPKPAPRRRPKSMLADTAAARWLHASACVAGVTLNDRREAASEPLPRRRTGGPSSGGGMSSFAGFSAGQSPLGWCCRGGAKGLRRRLPAEEGAPRRR